MKQIWEYFRENFRTHSSQNVGALLKSDVKKMPYLTHMERISPTLGPHLTPLSCIPALARRGTASPLCHKLIVTNGNRKISRKLVLFTSGRSHKTWDFLKEFWLSVCPPDIFLIYALLIFPAIKTINIREKVSQCGRGVTSSPSTL